MAHTLARLLAGLALIVPAVTACGGADTAGVTSGAVVPLDQATLADAAGKRVVGVGEATHGNKEFVQARMLVIQRLVREHGFRTVALEADFGGTAVADDYVVEGLGTAEQAAAALGFDIYRTRETASLLQWLHDHNAAVAAPAKVRLHGFDMQRYDRNKERLLRYLATVEPAQVRPVQQALADLTDATRSVQDKTKIAAAATAAERITTRMRDHEATYVRLSSPESFAVALHHAETIGRGARLQLSGADYARKRDAWMAEAVDWIIGTGREHVIVAGHNSHLDKTGAAFSFESMGRRLARTYGGGYFAIGTEFATSTFLSRDDSSGEREQFTVSHDSPLAKLFGAQPLGYVNLAQASATPANRRLLGSEIRMGSVGDGYRSIYSMLSWTYTVPMVPARAYDALVYVPRATPVTPL
ncbi:erythromycin esterase family protein [Nonomuraea gerenzanensis]|uniref:Succinoglycan biosynthesis n=1 Tax=Nonomuraea gerenzanensis TaxID=93944 RepID=A0A1M4EFD4_9ACTN|nr:erythromycin esterase family protein [Nonomuraea gerenzanensis]UBU09276.1 erythromycin esterase family protein [Nonomuraea gerenzanensis]SBO97677.1 succinoglycan biosynthesis [Nonomuraea gerenzanensis]